MAKKKTKKKAAKKNGANSANENMKRSRRLPLRSLVSDPFGDNPIDQRFLDDRWRGAVQVLTEELSDDVVRQLYDRMKENPNDGRWFAPYHHGFGTGIRNLLRSRGYTDSLFGANLDDVYFPILRDAVNRVIVGPLSEHSNVGWSVSWENNVATVQFTVSDASGLIRTARDVPTLLNAYINRNALDLARQISALEDMINSPKTKENDLQAFFEQYPHFLLGLEYLRIYPQVVLEYDETALIPDFFLEPVTSRLCDILDIKKPSLDLIVGRPNRRRFSSAVMDGVAQLREYSQYFDDAGRRREVRENHGFSAYKPKLILLIGRAPLKDDETMLRRIADDTKVAVKTYDELLAIAKGQLAKLLRPFSNRDGGA